MNKVFLTVLVFGFAIAVANPANETLEWVEEIRGRMSQNLQGYNQKLIAFGSSMSETLEELTNALGKYFIYNTC